MNLKMDVGSGIEHSLPIRPGTPHVNPCMAHDQARGRQSLIIAQSPYISHLIKKFKGSNEENRTPGNS